MSDGKTITQVDTDNSRLVLTADLAFTADELFRYFTQPDLLTQWWPQQALTEPYLGGHYQLSWPAMNWQLYGEYLAFEPGRRLVFTWQWRHQPELPQRQVETVFSQQGSGGRITLSQGTYTENQQDHKDRQSHIEGWNHFLGILQQLAKSPA